MSADEGSKMNDLDKLFSAYRDALPDPEATASFTPGVWQKIEARRSPLRLLRRMTEALVVLATAVAVLIGVFLIPQVQRSHVYQATYIDVLAAEQSSDVLAYATVVHDEPPADAPIR